MIICFLIFGCNDGDLQIETIDFDDSAIQFCSAEPNDLEETLFFKINQDEALILDLQANLLENVTSVDESINSSFPNESQLLYRLFSDNTNLDYFCAAIPPLTPTVQNEFNAESGTITITSKVNTVTAASKSYTHHITISDLSLTNDKNERLTNTSILDFGEYTTTTQSSVALLFANYADAIALVCPTAPVAGQLRLYKLLNDEALSLDIPASLLLNEATTVPRTADLASNASLVNSILNAEIVEGMACAASISDDLIINQFTATAGTVSVTTVAGAPDANGVVTYTHTISISTLILQDTATGTATAEIATVSFGTVTTS